MIATDVTAGGSAEDKLRWAFKMYDRDGSGNCRSTFGRICCIWYLGTIELGEMVEIIGTLYEIEGVSKVGRKVGNIMFMPNIGTGTSESRADI